MFAFHNHKDRKHLLNITIPFRIKTLIDVFASASMQFENNHVKTYIQVSLALDLLFNKQNTSQ